MLTELLEKYGNQKPMDLGSHIEKTIPVSAVIKMMEEYHESKVKNLSLGNVSKQSELLIHFEYFKKLHEDEMKNDSPMMRIDKYVKLINGC